MLDLDEDKMDVITISRQLGSLGSSVGRVVAERLGYRLVWRELINQAAIRAGAPEVALATIDDLGLLGLTPSVKQQQKYLDAINQVMAELANAGKVVIIGRAGQIVLHNFPRAFHIRIIAPVEVRIDRIVSDRNISSEAAQAQIEASDHTRKQYLSRFYHANWDDPGLYDLTINTARLDCQTAAALICHAAQLPISTLSS
jgi:cytidylate kinase